jgi:protein-S-isoprenylcysteine O-methyltransferase Ste14
VQPIPADSSRVRQSVQGNRIRHTRWFILALAALVLVAGPSRGRPEWTSEVLESFGIVCLLICLIGRGWTAIYVSGRKNSELVQIGPFSVVRNPLYVFSFIGVIGIGLISQMITFLLAAALVFGVYYAVVVRNEETYLRTLYGRDFDAYCKRVPRWFPRFSVWQDTSRVSVEPRAVLVHLRDSSLFFFAFFFFEMMEYLRNFGGVVPLFYLP